MRKKTVKNITATLTRTLFPTAGYVTPFNRGSECVLCINPQGNFAAGNITVENDNATAGTFTDVHAAADVDGGDGMEFYNITLGDNIAITAASVTAGECEVFLLGNT